MGRLLVSLVWKRLTETNALAYSGLLFTDKATTRAYLSPSVEVTDSKKHSSLVQSSIYK